MPETNELIRNRILSNDYADIIYYHDLPIDRLMQQYANYYPQLIDYQYAILTAPREGRALRQLYRTYSAVPKLFTLLDTVSLEASGIPQVWSQPQLSYTGTGILMGFIDTGIDYRNAAFRNPDGTTRILGIWDQTIQSGSPPPGLPYGSYYREDDINRALVSVNPLGIVPSIDENGHGTRMAGIACGSPDPSGSFSGAAYTANLLVVKLKPAKEYLRSAFIIPAEANAYQETDILFGVRFLVETARSLGMPLVISIGLGTNQGGHDGLSPLDDVLSSFSMQLGLYSIIAGGNEAGMAHHYRGQLNRVGDYQDVEILVDQPSQGFVMELWPQAIDLFAVGITSPLGETIDPIAPRLQSTQSFSLLLEPSSVTISSELTEQISGNLMIQIILRDPSPGIWRLRVVSRLHFSGIFHVWLPITGFIEPGIRFLEPDPYTTLTVPSCAPAAITVTTYRASDASLWLHSSRGRTRLGAYKPDIAAPGVDVTAPVPGGTFAPATGSSAACALAAGACALIIQWGINRTDGRLLSVNELKNLLYLGAERSANLTYPNREWGAGRLQVYGIFEAILSS